MTVQLHYINTNGVRLHTAMPSDLTAEAQERYREAWDQPGAITGMINWYRALLRSSRQFTASSEIRTPTLVLWGRQDPHISYDMAPLSVALCDDGRLVTFEDATHWVMQDRPEEVSQRIIERFSSKGTERYGVRTG